MLPFQQELTRDSALIQHPLYLAKWASITPLPPLSVLPLPSDGTGVPRSSESAKAGAGATTFKETWNKQGNGEAAGSKRNFWSQALCPLCAQLTHIPWEAPSSDTRMPCASHPHRALPFLLRLALLAPYPLLSGPASSSPITLLTQGLHSPPSACNVSQDLLWSGSRSRALDLAFWWPLMF